MAKYFLLVEKLPINKQDFAGWTPLHEACSSLHADVAELLLQNGADANISATDGTRFDFNNTRSNKMENASMTYSVCVCVCVCGGGGGGGGTITIPRPLKSNFKSLRLANKYCL